MNYLLKTLYLGLMLLTLSIFMTSCEKESLVSLEDNTEITAGYGAESTDLEERGREIDCTGLSNYNINKDYSVGQKAIFDGVVYKFKNSGWKKLGNCGTNNGNNCNGLPNWDFDKDYPVGKKVFYEGSVYKFTNSGWKNLGGCGFDCSGVSQWDINKNYSKGEKVTRDGILYKKTKSGWKILGNC